MYVEAESNRINSLDYNQNVTHIELMEEMICAKKKQLFKNLWYDEGHEIFHRFLFLSRGWPVSERAQL